MITILQNILIQILRSSALGDLHLFAQADTGGGATGFAGSVSTLIAAAMQTAGVFAQAEILANFQPFLKNLAALCYLVSITSALITVAMFGSYRRALYLLIGPPLFLYMVTTTRQVGGTALQTGARTTPGSVEDQIKFLSKYASSKNFAEGANVSLFFVGFDNLVSSVVQGVVSVIIDTQNKEDLMVKAREQLYAFALMAQPNNPAFSKLLAMGTFGECAEVTSKMWAVLSHRIDKTKRSVDADNLDAYGMGLKAEYDALKVKPRITLDHEIIPLITNDPQTQRQYRAIKVSCEQIWQFTADEARRFAKTQLTHEAYLGTPQDDGTIPWPQVEQSVSEAIGQGLPAQDVLAAYIIKNAMAKTTHAGMTQGVFNHVPFNAERRAGIYEEVNEVSRYGGFLRIQYFAKAIPYIQGILLYLLAASFPFFAIFLVMPSRANTFLIWASLWVWVKSWDIGFALLSVARKIMWMFVSAGSNKYAAGSVAKPGQEGSAIDWTRPETIFALIADNDPLANQNTYFTIIGLLTAAVPFFTAHCCLGATGLWDVFSMNISQRSEYYGGRRNRQRARVDKASRVENVGGEYRGAKGIQGGSVGRDQMLNGTPGANGPGAGGGNTAAPQPRPPGT